MAIARTDATGQGELDSEVLAFTTSLPTDQALYASDILGSLAHVRMLEESGLLPANDAAQIRKGLREIFEGVERDQLRWPAEEDVHMAIEVELTRRIGEPARRLHTARSRNDQIALDARLHLREQAVIALELLSRALEALALRAEGPEGSHLLPAYTHRQRAQPISVAYLLSAYGQMLARDAAQFAQVLNALDECPLGVGAVSGTSLPTRRERLAELLAFSAITANGLDTVGDRDFALDFTYAAVRCLLHLSRISADIVDFASQEFGFISLDDRISFGSSMMPHKKNPDLFELLRGKSSRAVGYLTALLTTVKGLPVGYMRDLQEDKESYLPAAVLLNQSLSVFLKGLDGIRFRPERMAEGLQDGSTQATDLAERLVARGLPFRDAYRAVGALVQLARRRGARLSELSAEDLAAEASPVTPEDLEVLRPDRAAAAKRSPGGTAPEAVARQLAALREAAAGAKARASATPRIRALIQKLA